MRHVTIEGLPLIARGGQAEIYDYGNGKVLRVAGRRQDFDRIRYEFNVYGCLDSSEVSVPHAYELVLVNEAPAIIMDKVAGNPMISLIARKPLMVGAWARELARLHLELCKVEAGKDITTAKAKAKYCISQSQILTDGTKQQLMGVLNGLPEGTSLCHGDFHPGNIICNNGKSYIIDWVGASRGDFLADVAHTYVLLRVVPKVPHISRIRHFIQTCIGRAMANRYLSEISRHSSFDFGVFSKWVLINAAERTYYGLESEKEHLRSFVEQCLGGKKKEKLYKML